MRCCPVCWKDVHATADGRRVAFHFDKVGSGSVCPMRDKAFADCYPLTVDPKLRGAA